MKTLNRFYIDGQWVEPARHGARSPSFDIVDPPTEERIGTLAMGNEEDADRAVAAARAAFPAWSETSRETRIALLERIAAIYQRRLPEIGEAVRQEIGAPVSLCNALQAPIGDWPRPLARNHRCPARFPVRNDARQELCAARGDRRRRAHHAMELCSR